MALPKPNKEETLEQFIERAMKIKSMMEKYPKETERKNACGELYKKKDGPGTGDPELEKNKQTSSASSSGGKGRTKYDDLEEVARIDYMDASNDDYFNKSFVRTDEGYLKGRAIVTNVGVFTYKLPGGGVQRELRPPEEVFANDSLNSLKLIPLTNNHPKEAVTSENIKKLQKGFVGDEILTDSYHVSAPIAITDEDTVMDVKDGKRSLSCGYRARLDYTPGTWMGVEYDAVQRDIRYNHVAVVSKGRAGDAVTMRVDGIDANVGVLLKGDTNINNGGKVMPQVLKIDGVDYEVDKDVAKHIHNLTKDASDLQEKLDKANEQMKNDKSTLEADRDTYKEKADKLEKEVEELKKQDPVKIDEAVNAKLELLKQSNLAGIELKDDMSDEDIKKEIILSVFPNSKEKLDGADEVYLQARFDSAIEEIEARKDEDDNKDDSLKKDSLKNQTQTKEDSSSSRQKMIDDAKNLWKKDKKED